jgi:hypothetical protein
VTHSSSLEKAKGAERPSLTYAVISAIVFLLVLISQQTALGQSRTKDVLVGSGDGKPESKGLEVPCGTIVQTIAEGFCTLNTSRGQVVGEYYLETVSVKPGGTCGWTVYRIQCK